MQCNFTGNCLLLAVGAGVCIYINWIYFLSMWSLNYLWNSFAINQQRGNNTWMMTRYRVNDDFLPCIDWHEVTWTFFNFKYYSHIYIYISASVGMYKWRSAILSNKVFTEIKWEISLVMHNYWMREVSEGMPPLNSSVLYI